MVKITSKIKNFTGYCKKLSLKSKIQIICVVAATGALAAAVTSYAWFNSQKKAAELYKISYPNSLYINAAHREDQFYFDLGEININDYIQTYDGKWISDENTYTETTDKSQALKITKKRYVFSVSGSNTTSYKLQLAHTTNNPFTYTIYNAAQYELEDIPEEASAKDIVKYKCHANSHTENPLVAVSDDIIDNNSTADMYYVIGSEVTFTPLNQGNDGLAIKNSQDEYYVSNYDDNTNVQKNAVPLYSQAICDANFDSNKKFCNYYILEITWDESAISNKETDLVYFSVQRTSG